MRSIGIMQPYLFPYLGYFQLINLVNKFIIYDDVTFIKQGWINRNNILVNNQPFLFTVPLENASSFCLIRDTKLNNKFYFIWSEKFIKTLIQNYRKAPYFTNSIELVSEVLNKGAGTVSELALNSLTAVMDYLDIRTEIVPSSVVYQNSHLKGQTRVLDICNKEQAHHYINPLGGQELYSKEVFQNDGILLDFINPTVVPYTQFDKDNFVSRLSVIDVLMFNDPASIREMLNKYELV
ncbi:WbqC family protein [Pontibacter ruber]|uniref:WbqC family protein n=1 Tax=Pontibacter ruber TaxID=1343895 RepID=A0ABW5CRA2_9BACT|nr:WbqC family protein [Pontibacter ruber]